MLEYSLSLSPTCFPTPSKNAELTKRGGS